MWILLRVTQICQNSGITVVVVEIRKIVLIMELVWFVAKGGLKPWWKGWQ